ncbi:MAG: segregation/condensation protein A, partial [Desulfuromusa sp.]|nr:segregation/condensation protein A [Desulfuromusa sp.]
MGFQIRLENFSGPLDLLLHLIKSQEMDIYDIRIVEITEQYLAIIKQMKQLDLDIAGEFLLMAATLVHIKSRMLLPVSEEIGEEEEDPRAELVKRLLEYQR